MSELSPVGPESSIDVVLCGGTYRGGDLFLPTTFDHSDDFGMLGGEIRVLAASLRAEQGMGQHVLFSGGKSRKGAAARGGEHVPAPPAAAVYAAHFTKMFIEGHEGPEELPDIPLLLSDTTSPNTN